LGKYSGIMLFLEIQRGKVEMPKWSERHRELGATTSCTLRATTTIEKLHHHNLILGDSWFSSVRTAEAIHESGHEWIGVVKTSHSLYPKKDLENVLKTWPGGMNLAVEAPTTKGVQLIAVGYKYNSSKVLCFVATKNAGSTVPGNPYRAQFLDDNDNLISWPVDRPELISTYFQWSNGIDKHNQSWQFELRLEKHWRMQNAWFHLGTTIIDDEEMTSSEFVDCLSFELIHNNFENDGERNTDTILSQIAESEQQSL